MSTIDLENLTIHAAHNHLVSGDFSARELLESCLENIERENPKTNAFLEIFEDAMEQADGADRRIKKEGDRAPMLTGIPIAMKDNILIKGRKVSCASKILESYVAPYDSFVAGKLKNAGAVFVGRTNMDEFAMGSSSEHSAYGEVRNPYDGERVPGGSSGGSASAVAIGGALGALGSDTGGSIRQPASFCGVVGVKPTYGNVSRSGLIAMASSFDQIGPFAKTIGDARILYEAISGYDPMDSTSLESAKRKVQSAKQNVIGVPYHLFEGGGIDADVLENFNQSVEKLKIAGYTIEKIELPYVKYSLPAYYIIMPAESSTNLARFDGVRYGLHIDGKNLAGDYSETRGEGFGVEVRRRILVGTYVLSHGYYDAYYNKARVARRLIQADFNTAFSSGIDCIAIPTTPTPAFKIGEKLADLLAMYTADIFTVPANIAGIPALSLPSGVVERGKKMLPVGLQLMAGCNQEDVIFEIGERFEQI